MFATIPSFLSAQPPRARAAPRSPSPSFSPPSPTSAYTYSPPPSPTSYSYSPPSPTVPSFLSSPAAPRPSLFATPSSPPSPAPSMFASSFSTPSSPSPSLMFPTTHVPASFSPAHFPATSPLRHAIVLNWEDVLAPTSLLTERVGLEPSTLALENARALLAHDTYLQQALASIEEQTLALLTTAARLGPVFVVTDKSLAYMEATCALFFPRLAIFLLQANMFTSFSHRIQVLAPPRHLLSTPHELATWKSTLFQSVCIDQLQRDAQHAFSLVTVSASSRDVHVSVGAAYRAAASLVVPKCVEVAHAPSLESFFAQLRTLHRYLDTAAVHKTAFSTRL